MSMIVRKLSSIVPRLSESYTPGLNPEEGHKDMAIETPVRIVRIINLGSHHIEFLSDGSVDIVNDPARPDEYVHLTPDEAYKLFTALYEQFKMQ
jgi:hypothetical protein